MAKLVTFNNLYSKFIIFITDDIRFIYCIIPLNLTHEHVTLQSFNNVIINIKWKHTCKLFIKIHKHCLKANAMTKTIRDSSIKCHVSDVKN